MGRGQRASRENDLRRIADALEAAAPLLPSLTALGALRVERKGNGDPVTEGERKVDRLLFKLLLRDGEGWLSEETRDDRTRLGRQRVWIVDPLDGTKEYVSAIPEYCISVALVEAGKPVVGGIHNPATRETFLGSVETGLVRGAVGHALSPQTGDQAIVLASRSEMKRGEWERFQNAGFKVQPMGSVAYKLALVAAGAADATWTLTRKNEWDVAGGVALVLAAGGTVCTPGGAPLIFNREMPLLDGLIALSRTGRQRLGPLLAQHRMDICA